MTTAVVLVLMNLIIRKLLLRGEIHAAKEKLLKSFHMLEA